MIDYVIFAATFVIFLIFAVVYLYPGSKRSTTIPGPEPVDPLEGNYPDIKACGSLHEFLCKLHEDYGAIVSFWLGPRLCASVASPQLFQEHSAVFDRPYELFKAAALLWGDDSLTLTNGADGRRRYNAYSKCFSKTSLNSYHSIYHKLSKQVVKSWSSWPTDQFLPLFEQLSDFAIRSTITTVLGREIVEEKTLKSLKASLEVNELCWTNISPISRLWSNDDRDDLAIVIRYADCVKQHFQPSRHLQCWTEVENYSLDTQDADGQREKRFTKHHDIVRQFVTKSVELRREKPPSEGEHIAIDAALELNLSESSVISDLMSLVADGFIKSSAFLTWACYFIASHSDIQEKLRKEALSIDDLNSVDLEKLNYIKKVLNETLRCAIISPFSARCQEFDTMLGEHKIPAGTPVVHALGIVLHDPTIFPDPDRFDPERFDSETAASRPGFSYEPFGFAGKRRCPGQNVAHAESTILLLHLLRSFHLDLAPDQIVIPQYGLVIKPKDEVWIVLKSPAISE